VKSKVPVSFPFVAFSTGPPARASYQPIVHWSVNATDAGLMAVERERLRAKGRKAALCGAYFFFNRIVAKAKMQVATRIAGEKSVFLSKFAILRMAFSMLKTTGVFSVRDN
jgi:hypothetical protein